MLDIIAPMRVIFFCRKQKCNSHCKKFNFLKILTVRSNYKKRSNIFSPERKKLMTKIAFDTVPASAPLASANLHARTDAPHITVRKDESNVEENARLRKAQIQKTNDTTVDAAENSSNILEGQNAADAQTPLETRFIEAQINLSASRQRLLRQILGKPQETFFLSSREMARRYGVDSSTIVRTVQALGYEKFGDFADDLRHHFVKQITPYTSMKAATQKNRSVADYVHQSIDQDLDNLNSLKATLNSGKIVELAHQIHRTKRIIVVGIDFAASLAMSLAYGLVRLGCDAEAPTGSSGAVQSKVRIMTEKDLLIAISFGQGLRETIEAVQRARRQNVPTFGITDGDNTPIARFCEQYIIASIERTSFLDSYVAPVTAINAILVACAHSQPKRALELLEQTDKEDSTGARWYHGSPETDPKTIKS